jgi:UDP-GlcNAc:undecaprenyl-phosphate/decaprenyl-phosphate GlcNAc-1-phosphate transferase
MFINYFPFIIPLIFFPILIYHKQISNAIGLLDYPDQRKKHLKPIPKLGGVYILVTSIFAILYLNDFYNERFIFSFLILIGGLFLIGFVDDKIEINAAGRLILQFTIIALAISVDFNLNVEKLNIGIISENILIYNGSSIFTIFCIISLVNATNLVDGKDGLTGMIFIVFLFYFLFFLPSNFNNFLVVLIISTILFLFYNIRGEIYLGNSGSYLIGGLMSFITIQNYNYESFEIEIIFLIFYIYGIDMLRVYLERLIRGIHPFTPENNHLHHYLFQNFSNKYLALCVYIILAYIPLSLHLMYKNYLILVVLSIVIYFSVFFYFKKDNNLSV